MQPNDDNIAYFRFTTKSRLDKAVHILEGLIRGIAADGTINRQEFAALHNWMGEHQRFANRHPFNEVIPVLNAAIADGRLDDEERDDLLWLCDRLTTADTYFDQITSDMQRLQGMMGGIAADGIITEDELRALRLWMDDHSHLKCCWPYDELESLISHTLRDGKIDAQEHADLIAFFADFFSHIGHRAISLEVSDVEPRLRGVCAVAPEVEFRDRLFCFTGSSQRWTRSVLHEFIERIGGRFSNNVSRDLDYLIIGADGNPCWTFACYGRKVEAAVKNRKLGFKVLLVHEYDFWDSIQDAGVGHHLAGD